MKAITSLLFLSIFLLFSCNKDDIEYQNTYEQSVTAYQEFKTASNNSYSYTSSFSSWIGYSTKYTIEVIHGNVHSRSFTYSIIGSELRPENGWTKEAATKGFKSIGYSEDDVANLFDNNNMLEKLEWKETKTELGTKEAAHNIWTLDDIYAKAKSDWLLKRENTIVVFENKNNGLISAAGYINKSCQDDCYIGINIKSIERLTAN